ncbi:MAG: leucine-rich repeat domain-containing protein [Ruminococcaceae bacterium]|nr:leucine-rich repeat domain-containing protein [Oscillospiraceae bacterium]
MKKLFLILFAVFLAASAICISAGAVSGSFGQFSWTLDDAGTLTISGVGPMPNWSSALAVPWADCLGEIKAAVIEEGVTSVGQLAFFNCHALTEVTLPASLRRIEQRGFWRCTALREVALPAKLDYVGVNAFYECTALRTMHIPWAVTFVSPTAFNGCTSLTKFTVDGANSIYSAGEDGVLLSRNGTVLYRYPPGRPDAAYTVADGVYEIWSNAFANCVHLESLALPESVQACKSDAFALTQSLRAISVYNASLALDQVQFDRALDLTVYGYQSSPAHRCAEQNGYSFVSLGEAESYFFWDFADGTLTVSGRGPMQDFEAAAGLSIPWASLTTQIRRIVVEEGITSIGKNAFANCTALTEVVLPSSLRRIGVFAFGKCTALTEIALPEGLEYIDRSVFHECDALKTLHIPASVTEMNERIFLTCDSLESFTVAEGNPSYSAVDGVLFSRDGSFLYRYPQAKVGTSYTVPDGVEEINENAFYYAVDLQTIHLPASVAEMDPTAFNACYSLTSITVAEDSRHYISRDGVLFTRDGIHLVRYPQAKAGDSYTVPLGVKTIDYNSFARVTELKHLILPVDVSMLDSRAFEMHESLCTVTIYRRDVTISAPLFPSGKQAVEIRGYAGSSAQHYVETSDQVSSEYKGISFAPVGGDPCGDGVYWTLDSDGLLTVWGQGNMSGFLPGESPAPWDGRGEEIRRVMIEDGVTALEDYAFYGCSALSEVTVGADVRAIGTWTFRGCDALRTVEVSEKNAVFSDVEGVLFSRDKTRLIYYPRNAAKSRYGIPHGVTEIARAAFSGCDTLTAVALPDTLQVIGDSAFFACNGLTAITLPDALQRIEAYAFAGCTGLTAVHIPAGVSEIGGFAFHGCSGLTAITVAAGNPAYAAEDGVLFSGDKTQLLLYPAGREQTSYAVPDTVSVVAACAFYDSRPEEVTLPAGLGRIGERAFYAVTRLGTVTLPARLTEIGAQAFAQCSSLLCAEVKSLTVRFGRAVFTALPRRFVLIGPADSTAAAFAADEGLAFRPDNTAFPQGGN